MVQVSSCQKETSSTTGMRESVETSPLLHYRSKVEVYLVMDAFLKFCGIISKGFTIKYFSRIFAFSDVKWR